MKNDKYNWDNLNRLQIGKYAEYYVKMEFTSYGFDVYTSEVDDKGIDFVIRNQKSKYYEIQVKSLRGSGYIFMQKSKFELSNSLYASIVIFNNGERPNVYLIPSTKWKKETPLLRSREYKGKKSEPEWGLNVSKKNLYELDKYTFENIVHKL